MLNLIRSGSFDSEDDYLLDDYFSDEDPAGSYETVIEQTANVKVYLPWAGNVDFDVSGGTWAPFRFASHFRDGPAPSYYPDFPYSSLLTLPSVDLVITSDTTMWTRCVVVEAQDDPSLSEGNQMKMGLRLRSSVDHNGNPDGSGTIGKGWFPGYAINLETGERLNIVFAEDSWLSGENGRDLQWNPTHNIITEDLPQWAGGDVFYGGSWLLGGKHYIYIMGGDASVLAESDYLDQDLSPSYDKGKWIYNKLIDTSSANYDVEISTVFQHTTWVGAPLLSSANSKQFGNDGNNTATVKLRVNSSYNTYVNEDPDRILNKDDNLVVGNTYYVADNNLQSHNYKMMLTKPKVLGGKKVTHNGQDYQVGETFVAVNTAFTAGSSKARVIDWGNDPDNFPINHYHPVYEFSTKDLMSSEGVDSVAVDALDLINVVPNPYYGYSGYEKSQLDNRIKITNLPTNATIRIYTVNGTLVKTIKKSDVLTSSDWDLNNNYGIPVASGLYVIHVDAEGVGEKILKWFGVLRPIDLDTF